jgi:hypothetical protein
MRMQLNEACLVLNVLEPDVKLGFLEWFLDLQIQDYKVAFDQVKVSNHTPSHVYSLLLCHITAGGSSLA